MITHVVKALVDRGARFWLIAAIGFASATVVTDMVHLPLWVRVICTMIAAAAAIWVIADSIRYSMTTIRAARARRRSHEH
jgi:hypothetical protein